MMIAYMARYAAHKDIFMKPFVQVPINFLMEKNIKI